MVLVSDNRVNSFFWQFHCCTGEDARYSVFWIAVGLSGGTLVAHIVLIGKEANQVGESEEEDPIGLLLMRSADCF